MLLLTAHRSSTKKDEKKDEKTRTSMPNSTTALRVACMGLYRASNSGVFMENRFFLYTVTLLRLSRFSSWIVVPSAALLCW